MKAKIKNIHANLGAMESKQSSLNLFHSIPIFTKKFSTPVPSGFRANLTPTSTVEEQLAAIEAERRQVAGRAYVGMLPPR